MTLEERVKSIVGKKIAIWCETEDEAEKLVDAMNVVTNEDYPSTDFDSYEDICYDVVNGDTWDYLSLNFYKNHNYEVIKFKDFITMNIDIELDIITTLTVNDVNELLNSTYGKDKWVIK